MSPRIVRNYVGVDPGKTGGIVCLKAPSYTPIIWPMPETERDVWAVFDEIQEMSGQTIAYLEKVSSSPQMGVTSAFTFGRGYGSLMTCLAAAEIRHREVRPQEWITGLSIPRRKSHNKTKRVKIKKGKNKGKWQQKKYGGETDTEWKQRLRRKAQQLYPTSADEISRQVADAVLIAEYCYQKER